MKAIYGSLIFMLFIMILVGCTDSTKRNTPPDNIKGAQTRIEIPIEGMSCSSCAATIKHTLSDLNGVTNVIVSLKNKKASLQYNPLKISLDSIGQSIDKVGYKAGKPKKIKE